MPASVRLLRCLAGYCMQRTHVHPCRHCCSKRMLVALSGKAANGWTAAQSPAQQRPAQPSAVTHRRARRCQSAAATGAAEAPAAADEHFMALALEEARLVRTVSSTPGAPASGFVEGLTFCSVEEAPGSCWRHVARAAWRPAARRRSPLPVQTGPAACESGVPCAQAAAEGEVPIGAVLVLDGRAVARAHNRVEASGDPTAHAELLAIQQARSRSLVSSFRFIPRVMTPQRI